MTTDARSLALLAALIEPLAEYMVADLTPEEWQDSPLVDRVQEAASLVEASGQELGLMTREALSLAGAARAATPQRG